MNTPLLALGITLGLLLAACGSESSPSTAPNPAAHAPMTPPFTATLSGMVEGDVTTIVAVIEVGAPLSGPMLVEVELPGGASLLAGVARETVARPKVGVLTREWRVRGSVRASNPVMLSVRQRDGDRAGAQARLRFPEEPVVPTRKFVPHPAVRAGGVPVRAAIDVQGTP
ncbi:MAG: hypothetical protein ACI9MR_002472 [Myxococcota bacterium]|jgi:hypothetical protein